MMALNIQVLINEVWITFHLSESQAKNIKKVDGKKYQYEYVGSFKPEPWVAEE